MKVGYNRPKARNHDMKKKKAVKKPWGGRFSEPTNQFVERFTASVDFDKKLALYDIRGSQAHAQMLQQCQIISSEDFAKINQGLEKITEMVRTNNFKWSTALEDVHMNIESELVKQIGEVGKKLHTARSRNDQVATDLRLYLRDKTDETINVLKILATETVGLAERESETLMPGYTHLQAAQPVTFGHHLLAWVEMLLRDISRFKDCRKRINVMPLGSGALAGTTFTIDRKITAKILHFDEICENSMDGVSDRDYVIEFVSACSLTMMHFSRMCEEMVLWCSQPFSFIELGDAFCTGSSMMPQKKNPDVPELVRGKSGRVFGHLMGLITLMKSQPLTYNKDNQEDKEPLFDSVNTLIDCTTALGQLVPSIIVNAESMSRAAEKGFIVATDIADYLVGKGVSFRDAHETVGKLVKLAIEQNRELENLELEEFQAINQIFDSSVLKILTPEKALASRDHHGGTAPNQVKRACGRALKRIEEI